MRTATVFRTKAKALKDEFDTHNYGEPDQPQFEFCVFTDGTVAQRWLIGDSMVWWPNLETLKSVHIYAHPDYGTEIRWSDGEVECL